MKDARLLLLLSITIISSAIAAIVVVVIRTKLETKSMQLRASASVVPSAQPSIALSIAPSISSGPSLSKSPSFNPTISSGPSISKSPSFNPTISSTPSTSSRPSLRPSTSISPSQKPSLALYTNTSQTWQAPSSYPSISPSLLPSFAPSLRPSSSASVTASSPTYSPIDYKYTQSETSICSNDGERNWQGPTPRLDNTVLQFFAMGDAPYDGDTNTCIGENGSPQDPCVRYDCSRVNRLPIDNTCTYEGSEFSCIKNNIIPYINDKIATGDSAFVLHIGDIIKGRNAGNNKRCSNATFESRRKLFSQCFNFLLTPGDNEWNECPGYNINSNDDGMRQLWREKFAAEQSQFHQFSTDFPSAVGGRRPNIARQINNPENLFFTFNKVAVFGLNLPAKDNYIENRSPVDTNSQWIKANLDKDRCDLKSIVIFGHTNPSSEVDAALQSYYDACSPIPTLVINGNSHPATYCMKKSDNRLTLTVEAFHSGPLLVSIVSDTTTSGDHFFHVKDKDIVNSNRNCPDLSMTD